MRKKMMCCAFILAALQGCMFPLFSPSEFYMGSRRVDKYEAKQVQKEKSWSCIWFGKCSEEEANHGS